MVVRNLDEMKLMAELHGKVRTSTAEIHKRIIGDDALLTLFFTCLLSSGLDFHGHILLEGVAGVGKTILMKTIAQVLDVHFERVDANSELLPSDIAGSETFNQGTRKREIRKGRVFTNILFIDEFNRLNGRTRGVLLQPMQEAEVVIADQRFVLEEPFIVLGTQNPTSYRNTDFLEPQERDRFMVNIVVGYPPEEEHVQIVLLNINERTVTVKPCLTKEEILVLRELIRRNVHIDDSIVKFSTRFVRELDPETASWNAGEKIEAAPIVRGSIHLNIAARTFAFLQGMDFVVPSHIKSIAPYILGHRIIPRAAALAPDEMSEIFETAFLAAVNHAR